MVEVLVHVHKAELPDDYVMLEISVPDPAIISINDSSSERLELLYQNGHSELELGLIGFSVPSIVIPYDRVVVLYPEAGRSGCNLAITNITPFAFDHRLFFPSASSRQK